ncbi:MAG: hypothetical protein AB199_03010 [Parcubacteria bacterium C7867-004]|nr:MAG: hypothetical protein AB199_03010 [Parcubacteria bacterium C7867-004]
MDVAVAQELLVGSVSIGESGGTASPRHKRPADLKNGDTVTVRYKQGDGWGVETEFRYGPKTEMEPADGGLPILGPGAPLRKALATIVQRGHTAEVPCGECRQPRLVKLINIR